MTYTLTPGRWRGLKTTSTTDNIFTILAFDQRGSFRKMLPADTSYADAVKVKSEVVIALTQMTSAVLLDSFYGLSPALHMRGGAGLLMALEESGYSGDSTYRGIIFNDDWTVAKIKQMGGSAVKLLAYYHPQAGALTEEIEGVVADVVAECHKHDLPLFLEPVSYSLDANVKKDSAIYAETRPEVVRETARRLSALGPDVLKLEFPMDAAFNGDHDAWRSACEAISEVSTVPWVLLSAGVDYETFLDQARIASQAGASGWLAGRAIWKECAAMSQEDRARFLAGAATSRTQELIQVATESARPWTDFYTPIEASEDWFKAYEA